MPAKIKSIGQYGDERVEMDAYIDRRNGVKGRDEIDVGAIRTTHGFIFAGDRAAHPSAAKGTIIVNGQCLAITVVPVGMATGHQHAIVLGGVCAT